MDHQLGARTTAASSNTLARLDDNNELMNMI